MSDQFRLFPGDEEASAGDAVIQFLIEQQKAGNKRAAAIGNALSTAMEEVFPNFSGALENVTGGADKRKQQLKDLFGFEKKPSVGEMALGFGVGSIKGIRGVSGPKGSSNLGLQLKGKEIIKRSPDPSTDPKRITSADLERLTGQENFQFEPFGEQVQLNIGGVKPPVAVLEAKAITANTKKVIQTSVAKIQKSLDRRLLEEVNPLTPNVIREIAEKGLRAKANFDDINQKIIISFK